MAQDQNTNDQQEAGVGPESNSYEIPGWQAGIADAYKGHEALKGMDVPTKLVEAYLESKGKLSEFEGRSYIPGENASSEEWTTYRKAMGVPDTKEGYQFNLPDDMDRNEVEGLASWIKDVAFTEGLPVQATQRIFDRWVTDTKKLREDYHKDERAKKQDRESALKEKYGEKWDTRVSSAKDFVKGRLGEEIFNSMMEKNLLDDPVYLDGFGKLSDALSEDNLPGTGQTTGGDSGRDPLRELFPTMK